ncbi:MAG TPA: hypothetical protein VGC42_31320 [Kofleriaceae bacterium]
MLPLLSICALAGCLPPDAPPARPAVDPDTAAFHDWKITGHVLGGDALISELDAAGFHGRAVVVAPERYSSPWSGGCDDPRRRRAPSTLAEVAKRYKLDAGALQLAEPITELQLSCGADGTSQVPPLALYVAGGRAATCWSGVCYLLAP